MCEGYDEYDELEDEVLGVILDAGKVLFNQAKNSTEKGPIGAHPSLHDLLFPPVRYFRLEASAGHISIVPIPPDEAYTCLAMDPDIDRSVGEEFDIDESLPQYAPDQIAVPEILLQGVNSITARVQVDGQDMF